MKIVELTKDQFEGFAKDHPLSSHYQSYYYGTLLAEYYFDYYLVGYVDNDFNIKAAAMVLTKNITKFSKYGYAPKGFLLDYNDEPLLKAFTKAISKYFRRKHCVMIKINPEIVIGEIHRENNFQTTYNQNVNLVETMKKYNYLKLKNNLYFESQFPRFNAIINLEEFGGLQFVDKNVRNKINKANRRGLTMVNGTVDDFEKFYSFIKNKNKRGINYYRDYFSLFNKENFIDFYLIKVDYEKFLTTAQQRFLAEQDRNEELIELMKKDPNEKVIARKMQSDRDLASFKNDIDTASYNAGKDLNDSFVTIAGALVMRYGKTASILISGFDEKFRLLSPNYILTYKLIEYYKNSGYKLFDMNGMTGDFTAGNPYLGLNKFKMGFKPKIYEYIGEFDLILKKYKYKSMNDNCTLAREFNKPWVKKGGIPEGIVPYQNQRTDIVQAIPNVQEPIPKQQVVNQPQTVPKPVPTQKNFNQIEPNSMMNNYTIPIDNGQQDNDVERL